MRVWLNQIDGTCKQVIAASFEELLEECSLAQSRLICQGSHLDASNFLELAEDVNVYETGDLDGGKKKKKKKVYTTKKKNKHIHKRVKLSIYTLYGIDGNSLLMQARVTSPSSERLAPLAAPAPSWPSTGTDITADSATPPSRWTPKPSRRTNKS